VRPPILWIAIGFAAGLWAGLAAWPVAWPAAALAVGVLVVARRAPVAAACAVAAVAGLGWGAAARAGRATTCAGRWAAGSAPAPRAAIVRLLDNAGPDGLVVDATAVGSACRGALRLRWSPTNAARGGTTWVVVGSWLGTADRGLLRVRQARLLDAAPRGRGWWRGAIAARSAALFGSRAPLVDALVLGRRGDLEPEQRERYARSGLTHILSISGLHVGFIAAWLGVLLRLTPLGATGRFGVATAAMAAYVWLLGWPPPAARAALMLAVDGLGRARGRLVAPRGTIGLTVLVLLGADPWALRSLGAWLSVTAVAAVIWAGRQTARDRVVVRLVTPSVAATLLTAPITAAAFGTVAPVGVLANLLAIPLAAVAVPGLFIALLVAAAWDAAGAVFAGGAGLGLALLDLVAGAAAAVPGGHVVMPATPASGAVWAVVAAAAWWVWRVRRAGWTAAARVAFAACLVTWGLAARGAVRTLDAPRGLTVHFLDVGQGDAAALRTPHGRWIVIDGGPRTPAGDAGRRVVVPFLRRHGVRQVALVVASHGDADHIGGLPAVVAAFRPLAVLEPGEPLGKPLYLEWLAAVEEAGAAWRTGRAGDRVTVDGVTLEVLSPDGAWLATPMDANEHSVVLLVRYGATRLLFAGDAGLPVEARLTGQVGPVDLLKVGHHGSRSATSAAWLTELRPRVAVISVGRDNRYGHPAGEVLERLARHDIPVLRTDRDGTITWTTDGTTQRTHPDVRRDDRAVHHGAGAAAP
jgi:competence protein ComEC